MGGYAGNSTAADASTSIILAESVIAPQKQHNDKGTAPHRVGPVLLDTTVTP